MAAPRPGWLTRRRFLLGAGSRRSASARRPGRRRDRPGAGAGRRRRARVPTWRSAPSRPACPPGSTRGTRTSRVDQQGNSIPPQFDRLLFFDVIGTPAPAYARLLEAALRTLERTFRWMPSGLLFTAGLGAGLLHRRARVARPIPPARALSDFEQPAIDDYHLCLHIASDDEARLAAVEAALTRGTPIPHYTDAAGPLDISAALRWRETRTGFVGAGLPAERQDTGGIPGGQPVPGDAPLFMGFKSALKRNQATEDDVTIADGPFAGGTTMHASYMRLRLDTWYAQLSQQERVARMYAPQVTQER